MKYGKKHISGKRDFLDEIVNPESPITASLANRPIIPIAPDAPCEQCVRDQGVIRSDGTVQVYCSHNLCGAFFNGEVWTTHSPIPERRWLEILGRIVGESRQRVQYMGRWLQRYGLTLNRRLSIWFCSRQTFASDAYITWER